jgi:hypothetical protein
MSNGQLFDCSLVCLQINCRYPEKFGLYTDSYSDVTHIFFSHLCPDIFVFYLASYIMWNRLYFPLQCKITQRPPQHDTLHLIPIYLHRSRQMSVNLLQTVYKQQPAFTGSFLLLRTIIWIHCAFIILCLSILCNLVIK